ncbi:hypothetical protein MLAC_36010 [Mycobacterium lacus]|uniref:Amidohydrolase 3 domain-containing protein n=1 Tax=Mycobacterium lacus TaxID=169765 RepID=A0A7I7NRZ9_9MYCO|nr:hypothetical protein MLAC_36010 [Mycobacterium lacus]
MPPEACSPSTTRGPRPRPSPSPAAGSSPSATGPTWPRCRAGHRAQTVGAAWRLFADDVVGSLEVGKYADAVVLSADPRTVAPERIADLGVRATFLAGRQVYGAVTPGDT